MTDPEATSPQFPSREDISGVYTEVLEYNRKHTGFGGIFSTVLATTIEAGDAEDALGPDAEATDIYKAVRKAMDERTQETDLHGDLVAFTSDESMATVGLRLEPTGSYLASGDERASSRELEARVDSPKRFSDFLGTLDAAQVKEDESFRKLTSDVLGSMAKTIQAVYAPDPGKLLLGGRQQTEIERIGEGQLQAFSILADSYEALGLDDTSAFKRMSEYTKRWGVGVLPDYLVAETKAYLEPDIQGWGPASWQKDISPEKLAERWDEAMDFVRYLRQDSKKAAFADEVYTALEASMGQAQNWMNTPEEQSAGYSAEYLQPVKQELEKIAERFKKLKR